MKNNESGTAFTNMIKSSKGVPFAEELINYAFLDPEDYKFTIYKDDKPYNITIYSETHNKMIVIHPDGYICPSGLNPDFDAKKIIDFFYQEKVFFEDCE